MANTKRLLKLADVLARGTLPKHQNVGFNMGTFLPSAGGTDKTGRHCKTTCCIAGWAVLLFDSRPPDNGAEVEERAIDLLGLKRGQVGSLFYNGNNPSNLKAAAVIRHLAETREVDWDRFKRDGTPRKAATP